MLSDNQDNYPSSKEIISLLGIGSLLLGSILVPGLGATAAYIVRKKRKMDYYQSQKAWKKFNLKYLKRNLKRLQEQKIIEIISENDQEIIKLSQKGYTKYLKFKLQELSLKGKRWDGKWRIVIYDINKIRTPAQKYFRGILKYIHFLQLQKSVYLTPFKCEAEIEYLKHYLDIDKEVMLLEVSKLENEKYYKEYFGLQ